MHTTATVATMNFVGYVGDAEHREIILERAEAIAAKYPARLIVLDGTNKGALGAPFFIASQNYHQIGRFVAESTLRNIPTVLWWASTEPISAGFFAELARQVNDVVVESSCYLNRTDAIESLNAFHAEFKGVSVRDLAWLRGREWRDAVAHLFDHPIAVQHLQSMRAIHITGGSPAEAQYTVGWLASRLGWLHEGEMRFRTRDGRTLNFMHTTAREGRHMREIRLASALANFRIVLDEFDSALACFSQVDATPVSVRHIPFHRAKDSELIEAAILTRGTDELFEASMRSLRII